MSVVACTQFNFTQNEEDEVLINTPIIDLPFQLPAHNDDDCVFMQDSSFTPPSTTSPSYGTQTLKTSWGTNLTGSPMASSGSEVPPHPTLDLDIQGSSNHTPNACVEEHNARGEDDEVHFRVDDEILLNMPPIAVQEMSGKLFHSEDTQESYRAHDVTRFNNQRPFMSILRDSFDTTDYGSNSSISEPKQPLSSPIESPANSPFDFIEIKGKFVVEEKIGEGTFSSVYKAYSLETREIVALKRVYPTCSPSRILNEMQHLKLLGGNGHVPRLLGGLRHRDQVTIVIPYFPHDKFKEVLPHMSIQQTRQYMKALFESLHHLHHHGVIHRDIKPGNFLWNSKTNQFMLVDFGLAQNEKENHYVSETGPLITVVDSFPASAPNSQPSSEPSSPLKRRRANETVTEMDVNPSKRKRDSFFNMLTKSSSGIDMKTFVNKTYELSKGKPSAFSQRISVSPPRAGTRGFRAPEVLLKSFNQTVAVDIWSAGVIFLCVLSTRYPFFQSPNDLTSLVEIASIFGTKEVKDLALSLNRRVVFPFEMPKQNLRQLIHKLAGARSFAIPESAFDLLGKCLELDPRRRISAAEAMQHPFFTSAPYL